MALLLNNIQSEFGLTGALQAGSWTLGDSGVWISGTANGRCFVSSMADANEGNVDQTLILEHPSSCGKLMETFGETLVYGGVQETHKANVRGFLRRYDLSTQTALSTIALDELEYPISGAGSDRSLLYVASLNLNHPQEKAQMDHKYEDWMLGRAVLPRTDISSSMTIQAMEVQGDGTVVWQTEWKAAVPGVMEIATVLPAGILDTPNYLIVSGSTFGIGRGFGDVDEPGDYDGFVTLLDKTTGDLWNSNSSKRIGTTKDDWILGMCHDDTKGTEAQDVYIVGATKGSFQGSEATPSNGNTWAFVQKFTISKTGNIETAWMHAFDTQTTSLASNCVVDSGNVFVGGTITGGGAISDTTAALGDTDVWLAEFDTTTGDLGWVDQYGSIDDDQLAELMLVGGDLGVYAETYGDWFNHRTNNKQQFVLSRYSLDDGSLMEEDGGVMTNVNQPQDDDGDDFVDDYIDDALMPQEEGEEKYDDDLPPDATPQDDTLAIQDDDDDGDINDPHQGGDGTDNHPMEGDVDDIIQEDDDFPEDLKPSTDYDPSTQEEETNLQVEVAMAPASAPTVVSEVPPVVLDQTKQGASQSGFLPNYGETNGQDNDTRDNGKENTSSNNNDFVTGVVFHGKGFQSNIGPSYAGGMIYDFTRDAVVVSGQTYPTSDITQGQCIILEIPIIILRVTQQQNLETLSSCSPIIEMGNELYVSGIQDIGPDASIPQKGIVSSFHWDIQRPDWNSIIASKVLNGEDDSNADAAVLVPMAMAVGDSDGTTTYVASMVSQDGEFSQTHLANQAVNKEGFPNFTTGGHLKYGSSYSVAVDRLTKDDHNNLIKSDSILTIKPKDDDGLLFLSGMEMVGNSLIVVGSTTGNVDILGKSSSIDNLMDGFLVKIDTSTGFKQATRLNPFTDTNDWIMNICSQYEDQVYVVGATMVNENDSVFAFVAKINMETMGPVWTQQLKVKGEGTASAFGCRVLPNHQEPWVYVAGLVKNGSVMDYHGTQSYGSDDVFVAQLNTSNGKIRWLKQLGSSGHESLARNGGISVDMDGNAILYGDTTGELYRSRSPQEEHASFEKQQRFQSDLFVVTLNKSDGSYAITVEESRKGAVVTTVLVGLVVAIALVLGSVFCRKRWALRWLVNEMSSDRANDERSGLIVYNSDETSDGKLLKAVDKDDQALRQNAKSLLLTMNQERKSQRNLLVSQPNIFPSQEESLKGGEDSSWDRPGRNFV